MTANESGLFHLPDIQSPPAAAQEAKSVKRGHSLGKAQLFISALQGKNWAVEDLSVDEISGGVVVENKENRDGKID